MARVHFTARLRGIAPPDGFEAAGNTVGDVLAKIFAGHDKLEGYVLDEQGRLRRHVCIFLDGTRLAAESALATSVGTNSEIYVMQALSGG